MKVLALPSSNEKNVKFGTETVTHKFPQVWNSIPGSIKNAVFLKYVKR